MEILTPQLIWKGYDASVLPLNVSVVSERACDGMTVLDAYFNGSTVTDGVVRVSVRCFIPDVRGKIPAGECRAGIFCSGHLALSP